MTHSRHYFGFFLFLLFSTTGFAKNSLSGQWQVIDEVSHQPTAVIELYETHQTVEGRITKIYPKAGKEPSKICMACQGSQHNQKLVGMTIVQGLKQDAGQTLVWSGGTILDPKNGKEYSCTMQLTQEGKVLKVRGYLGIALLGRTELWNKLT